MAFTHAAQTHLSNLVNRLWTQVQQEHERYNASDSDAAYQTARTQYFEIAALATTVDHPERDKILKRWGELQDNRIHRVTNALVHRKEEIELEAEITTENAAKLSKKAEEATQVWTEIQKQKAPNPDRLQHYMRLTTETAPLQEQIRKSAVLTHTVEVFATVITQLKQITELPYLDKINYNILGPAQIAELVAQDQFREIPVERFEVVPGSMRRALPVFSTPATTATITTPSAQTSAAVENGESEESDEKTAGMQLTDLTLANKPPELIALVQLKDAVGAYATGSSMIPRGIRETLDKEFHYTTGIIASYLREAPLLFGVAVDDYKFRRESTRPLTTEEFLREIVNHLRPSDQGEISKFYISRALERWRKKPEAYAPFTRDDVIAEIKNDGCILSRKIVAINLGRFPEHYGVQRRKDIEQARLEAGKEKFGVYEFTEVKYTPTQLDFVRQALPFFGYNSFTINEVVQKVNEQAILNLSPQGMASHARVFEAVLCQHHESFGLTRQAGSQGMMYQRKDRPNTAQDLHKATQAAGDMNALA